VLGALLAVLGAAAALAAKPGSAGSGDPFFPRAGNGGYNVAAYHLALRYRPRSGVLAGRARIAARARIELSRFNLDLGAMRVRSVAVNGERARFSHRGTELAVRPGSPLGAGGMFRVRVRYRGRPGPMVDPDGSLEGWFRTADGAFVVGEPLGTQTWAPVNNALRDKARWTLRVTVPRPLKAVGNGRLMRIRRRGGLRTWTWSERSPMSPYLATVSIGRGTLRRSRAGGVPSWVFVDPREARESRASLARIPQMMRFLERVFGPYPFASTGAIVDHAPRVGYALESQTRPIYDRATDDLVIVHELAHQWYGDSVSLRTWPQMWLNEGFATWAEWIWSERHGGPSAKRTFRRLLAVPASRRGLWDPPPGRLRRPRQLFSSSTYLRGAMTLQALRMKIGTRTFLRVMRRWAAEHAYGNATTRQFIVLSERMSGRQLDALFRRWLFRRGKPVAGGGTRAAVPTLRQR